MNSLPDTGKPARLDTILVLDDEVLVRMPICQYLRDCGYRVLEAADSDEAATILQKQEIQVDVEIHRAALDKKRVERAAGTILD